MTKPRSVSSMISLELVQELALPSNIRYGTAIYERGAIEFIESTPEKIEAWAGGLSGTVTEGGGSRRRVQLFLADDGIAWHCAGNPKNHQIFCKHCVALALAIINSRA
ncbi:MAG TPA: hypothetical protein VLG92_02175 [Candidatus Saccharimonadia bacterium]|nr:hypothetical protein [Candidatus Saccharimonadia bacterium]